MSGGGGDKPKPPRNTGSGAVRRKRPPQTPPAAAATAAAAWDASPRPHFSVQSGEADRSFRLELSRVLSVQTSLIPVIAQLISSYLPVQPTLTRARLVISDAMWKQIRVRLSVPLQPPKWFKAGYDETSVVVSPDGRVLSTLRGDKAFHFHLTDCRLRFESNANAATAAATDTTAAASATTTAAALTRIVAAEATATRLTRISGGTHTDGVGQKWYGSSWWFHTNDDVMIGVLPSRSVIPLLAPYARCVAPLTAEGGVLFFGSGIVARFGDCRRLHRMTPHPAFSTLWDKPENWPEHTGWVEGDCVRIEIDTATLSVTLCVNGRPTAQLEASEWLHPNPSQRLYSVIYSDAAAGCEQRIVSDTAPKVVAAANADFRRLKVFSPEIGIRNCATANDRAMLNGHLGERGLTNTSASEFCVVFGVFGGAVTLE